MRKSRVVSIRGLVVGEELVMRQHVALVDAHQPLDRAMHDEAVHRPFEDVAGEERGRHHQPFEERRLVDVAGAIPDRREPERRDHRTCPSPLYQGEMRVR